MINKLKSVFSAPAPVVVPVENLDTILSSFHAVSNRLTALVSRNNARVATNDNVINVLRTENNTLNNESAGAERVRLKIVDLVS